MLAEGIAQNVLQLFFNPRRIAPVFFLKHVIMYRTGTFVSFFLTFCLAANALAQAPNSSGLRGIVTNLEKQPLKGATVMSSTENGQLIKQSFTSDDGSFKMLLNPGTYVIIVKSMGYSADTSSVTVSENNMSTHQVMLSPNQWHLKEMVVSGTRATSNTPIPHENISKESIEKLNQGVDFPILLDQTVSVVTTSDAGAGVGYTGFRIRGSDPSRVNVTVNGIPLNDAESQGVFWVNMPDFASSVSSVQIQRGVGTSTNGAGAFGATVNLNTFETAAKPYAMYAGSAGSFNTQKHTVAFGTGILKNNTYVDGRLSRITSDGFIDRSSSDLQSYYLSAGKITDKSHLKFITFAGQERTYQSWYGVPQGAMDNGNRTFNPYDYPDQVDNYGQTHYQLHYTRKLTPNLNLTSALHYTRGEGYFEEYKGDRYNQTIFNSPQDFSDYNLAPVIIGNDTIEQTNLIRRRWLKNDYYGGVFTLQYNKGRFNTVVGGGFHKYEGDHFGEVIWAQYSSNARKDYRWYEGNSTKTDWNAYARTTYQASRWLSLFTDLQYRGVRYETQGQDNDLSSYDVDDNLGFFNPKVGASANISQHDRLYASFAVANREPSRNDYIDRAQGVSSPNPERLHDYELGYQRSMKKYAASVNLYYMDYTDQLVLTGAVNDVGSAIRQNVANSYRAGIELTYAYRPFRWLTWTANATFSQNKIEEYDQLIYSWDAGSYPDGEVISYSNTDIAYSPNVIAANTFEFTLPGFIKKGGKTADQIQFAIISKYVGEQHLDNSGSDLRKLDAYFVNDLRLNYTLANTGAKSISFNLLVRNAFSELYASNGWVYRFRHPDQSWGPASDYDIYAERDTEINTGDDNDVHYFERGLFPQAPIHFLAGLTVKF